MAQWDKIEKQYTETGLLIQTQLSAFLESLYSLTA